MENYLGIDYGSKRIGLAIGDDETGIARALTILDTGADWQAKVRDAIKEFEVVAVVVGLPRGLDGQETDQTGKVRQVFANAQFGVPIYFQDEAMTSEVVGSGSKSPIDDQAAALILQDYLDNL